MTEPHVGALFPDPKKLNLPTKKRDKNVELQDLIRETRKVYAGFQPIFCPAIREIVYFPMDGFDHLIMHEKNNVQGRRRNHTIKSRMKMVPLIPDIVEHCQNIAEVRYFEEDYHKTRPKYFALEDERELNGEPAKMRVVFRRKGSAGKFQFQSIMRFQDRPAPVGVEQAESAVGTKPLGDL